MADRPKILVLGGGFGGVGAVKKLKHADADVLLASNGPWFCGSIGFQSRGDRGG